MDPSRRRPYVARYTGFDVPETRNAQTTADRARDGARAPGEDANREYVDDGPAEAARRTGRSAEDLGAAIDRARRRR